MTKREIEMMLKNAAEKMPMPEKNLEEIVDSSYSMENGLVEHEWETYYSKENSLAETEFDSSPSTQIRISSTFKIKQMYAKWMENIRLARFKPILTMLAILLGIGILAGGVVYASGEYGGWVGIRTKEEIEMTHDVKVRESYGKYQLYNTSTINVAPYELENYEQSLFHSKYKADCIDYRNTETENTMSITLGSTEKEYWKYHFGYDEMGEYRDYENMEYNEHDWSMLQSEVFEYKELKLFYSQVMVYGDGFTDEKVEFTEISWVDNEKRICVDMTISYELVDQEEMLEYAKQFIDDYQERE